MNEDQQLRLGLVGLGNSGWYYHAVWSIEPVDGCTLVAVCSRDGSRVREAERRFGARGYVDHRDLLDDASVDAVVVATPHHQHHEIAMAAIRAGKHVIIEKPMTIRTSDADELIRAAEREGVVLSVFHQRRWEADYQAIRQAVVDGEIGEVWAIRRAQSHQGPTRAAGIDGPGMSEQLQSWPLQRSAGGGVGYLIGPHSADHVLQLAASPLQRVMGRMHRWSRDEVEHYLEIWLEFPDRVLGHIEIYRRSGAAVPPKWAIHGTEGTIKSKDGTTVEIAGFDGRRRLIRELPALQGCPAFYAEFHEAIRDGARSPVTGAAGRDAVRVIELALLSAASDGAWQDVAT